MPEPLTCWRITEAIYVNTAFEGIGAQINGGRWNPRGQPVAYCAGSLALAVLESRVHQRNEFPKAEFCAIECRIPADIDVEELDASALPSGWNRLDKIPASTREFGRLWLEQQRTLALTVPSAILPEYTWNMADRNILINPRHPDFPRLRAGTAMPFAFDPRLFAPQA